MRILLLFLFLAGCSKDFTIVVPSGGQVSLSTDSAFYTTPDSVHLFLKNESASDIIIGYRCSRRNLEMSFQKKENGQWSEYRFFDYMFLDCMTIPDTVAMGKTIKHSISSSAFKSLGVFRLIMQYYIQEKDSIAIATSNNFEVR